MLTLRATTFRLIQDRRAVTSIEYAIIVGLIAIVIFGAVSTIGPRLSAVFQNIASNVTSA